MWQGGRKNDSRYVSNGADYMLIYAKNEARLSELGVRWREPKVGLETALAKAAAIWSSRQSDDDASAPVESLAQEQEGLPARSPIRWRGTTSFSPGLGDR